MLIQRLTCVQRCFISVFLKLFYDIKTQTGLRSEHLNINTQGPQHQHQSCQETQKVLIVVKEF